MQHLSSRFIRYVRFGGGGIGGFTKKVLLTSLTKKWSLRGSGHRRKGLPTKRANGNPDLGMGWLVNDW